MVNHFLDFGQASDGSSAEHSARFFAMAVHDLRQPIHAMSLFLAQLQQHTLGDEPRLLTERMVQSLGAMESLLNRLLQISRLDGGILACEPTAIAIDELWRQAGITVAEVARGKGLTLKFRPSSQHVLADGKLLAVLLEALILNAINWTDQGRVLVACRRRGERLRLEVRDSGAGIAPDLLPQVFDDFPPLPRQQPGKALGLALVRRIAQRLGGRLEVRSAPEKGSVFAVELPWAPPPLAQPTVPAEAVTRVPGQPLVGRRVLLVEPRADIRQNLGQLLENWGCRVTHGQDEATALGLIHTLGEAPELVLFSSAAGGLSAALAGLARFRHEFGEDLATAVVGAGEEQQAAREAACPFLALPPMPARARALVQSLLLRR